MRRCVRQRDFCAQNRAAIRRETEGVPMLSELKTSPKVVGTKQVRRALKEGGALRVFIAGDADPGLTAPLRELCESCGVPVEDVPAMRELGRACGIAVSAAVAALVR